MAGISEVSSSFVSLRTDRLVHCKIIVLSLCGRTHCSEYEWRSKL